MIFVSGLYKKGKAMKHIDISFTEGFWQVKDRDSEAIYLTTNRKESAVRFGNSLNSLHGTGMTIFHENGNKDNVAYVPKDKVWLRNVLG
ncbi:MAG: hypothetical protein J0L62_00020 [Bacteroidetes bacterium]|nr:hypothetical protein [Bacteroidota bacterium]